LPEPEACPSDAEICGGDPEKYPAKEIDVSIILSQYYRIKKKSLQVHLKKMSVRN